jgi:hypothetical protein
MGITLSPFEVILPYFIATPCELVKILIFVVILEMSGLNLNLNLNSFPTVPSFSLTGPFAVLYTTHLGLKFQHNPMMKEDMRRERRDQKENPGNSR